MVKDRGMKKWTAMMLPEHLEKLTEWNETLKKPKRPVALMPWESEEIQQKIDTAYRSHVPISLTIFKHEKWTSLFGLIRTIKINQALLFLESKEGLQQIHFDSIQGVELDDSYT